MDRGVSETERLLRECLVEENDLFALALYQKVYNTLEAQPELQKEYELVHRKVWVRKLTYYQMELESKRKALESMEKRVIELENKSGVLQSEGDRTKKELSKYQEINHKLLAEIRMENLFTEEQQYRNLQKRI